MYVCVYIYVCEAGLHIYMYAQARKSVSAGIDRCTDGCIHGLWNCAMTNVKIVPVHGTCADPERTKRLGPTTILRTCLFLYMCVYLHACMYVCMYACMHVCMYACLYACRRVCMYACMYDCGVRIRVGDFGTSSWASEQSHYKGPAELPGSPSFSTALFPAAPSLSSSAFAHCFKKNLQPRLGHTHSRPPKALQTRKLR